MKLDNKGLPIVSDEWIAGAFWGSMGRWATAIEIAKTRVSMVGKGTISPDEPVRAPDAKPAGTPPIVVLPKGEGASE